MIHPHKGPIVDKDLKTTPAFQDWLDRCFKDLSDITSTTSTFTLNSGAGQFATVQTITVKYHKQGKQVTLLFPVLDVANNSSEILSFSTIDSSLRPQNVVRVSCGVIDSGSYSSGVCSVYTNGLVSFTVGGTEEPGADNFTADTNNKGISYALITYWTA